MSQIVGEITNIKMSDCNAIEVFEKYQFYFTLIHIS